MTSRYRWERATRRDDIVPILGILTRDISRRGVDVESTERIMALNSIGCRLYVAALGLLPSSEVEQIVDRHLTAKLPPFIVIIIKTTSLEPGSFVDISSISPPHLAGKDSSYRYGVSTRIDLCGRKRLPPAIFPT